MAVLGTRSLLLSIGGTEYNMNVSNCTIESGAADSDFTTFADAAAGGARQYTLNFTAVQDPAAGSLWDKVFTSAGSSIAVIVKPAGGTAASATTPWFSGNVTITEPDGTLLGGDANSSTTARFTFAVSWVFAAKPVRTVA